MSSPSFPPVGVIVLNRMGFGPRPGDLEKFQSLGITDAERIAAYVEQQVHPETLDDSALQERLRQTGFITLQKSLTQLWADHVQSPGGNDWTNRVRPFNETERATFLRAIYSRRQLNEVLADFWHNHFNVLGTDSWAAPVWVHYDRDIIRANIFGNFRKMLEDVATSLPMLVYLNNYANTVSGPNENYARELFELHGLGAENYFGVKRQDEVPVDDQRIPLGYVDDDVYESTRAFTGWTIDFDTGTFAYKADQHDRFQKYVLGRFLRADQAPMKDGRDVLDAIAAHPGTGRFIARKLARRLIADDPPQRVVNEAAQVFFSQRAAPDQLRQVIRTILLSPEFRTTWGEKVKRPFEAVVSSLRAIDADIDLPLNDEMSNSFFYYYAQAGQPLFRWPTPDGYSDRRAKWVGSNPLVSNWRMNNWIVEMKNWWNHKYEIFNPIRVLPPTVRSAQDIADFWIDRILHRPLADSARAEIVDFLARGRDPAMAIPSFDDENTREQVWGMVALILSTPEHLVR